MNFNQEYYQSLPQHNIEQIEFLLYQYDSGSINKEMFFEEVRQIIGDEGAALFFNINQEQEIKTEKLVDVIEYSGVDLKRETDIFNRESVRNLRVYDEHSFVREREAGRLDELSELLDRDLFSDYIQKLTNSRQIGTNANAVEYLFKGLKSKLCDLIEKADFASKIRTDYIKHQFDLKLVELNDVKKQLFVLEEEDKIAMEDLRRKNPAELEVASEIKPEYKEREDVLIKKKTANILALEALGSKKTDFMNFEDELISETETGKNYPLVNLFSDENINEMERKIKTRRITLEDMLFVFENDPRYEKSLFVMQHYFK
ncbi:hypothetical protein CDIK_1564 [Cucumispora dikerogammari]|nr:hypothetical protein CDIK_1564 [Cucumispora dikerogammari]